MSYLEFLVDTPKYKAGTRAHVTREAAAALTSIGMARVVRPDEITDAEKGIAPAVVSWRVQRSLNSQRPAIVGRCSREVCGMVRFEGKPEFAGQTIFIHSHAGSTPEKVPVDVLNQYVAAVKENPGEYTPDEAAMLATGAYVGDSNKHRDLFRGYGAQGKPIYAKKWW